MSSRLTLLALSSFATACGGSVTSAPTDAGSDVDAIVVGDSGGPSSGGAFFQMQGGSDPEASGKFLACPDAGRMVTISVKGTDGTDKLVVDGVGGATATCSVTASTFAIDVANGAGRLTASGTYTTSSGTMDSIDATVTITFPGASYATGSTKCTIGFDPAQSTGGKLFGKLTCSKLASTTASGNACAISAVTGSFFRFANCK